MGERQGQIHEFGDFRLDAARRLLTARDGRVVTLTPKPFETLLYLVRHSGTVLGKDELMKAVWPDTIVEENNLSQSISQLRRALGEKPGEYRYIATVQGRGFRFVAPVRTSADDEYRERSLNATSGPEAERSEAVQIDSPGFRRSVRGLTTNLRLVGLASVFVIVLCVAGLFLSRPRTVTIPLASDASSAGLATAPAATIKNIAVLPFKPLVQGEEDRPLELGMADTLIAKLSNSRQVVVRPISAVRRYGSMDQDPLVAGRELNVEAVLDGHIQKHGERVRVTARLLGVSDGRQLWAGQFDENMTDIFAVQDAISERVATALALTLSGEENARLKWRETANIEAYQLCLRGRYFVSKRLPDAMKKANEFFRQAIVLDPNYALAYSGLADTYAFQAVAEHGGISPSEVMPKTKEAAQKALALDDTLAEAHISMARAAIFERDWPTVEREIKRGLELDPTYSDGRRFYALYLARKGRLDDALAEAQRAWEIEPGSINRMMVVGWIHYLRREHDQAIEQYKQTLALDQNYFPLRFRLGLAFVQKGMFEQAVAELHKSVNLSARNPRIMAFLGYAYGQAGRRGEAQRIFNELQARSKKGYVASYDLAIIHLGLGDTERALELLHKANQERDDWVLYVKVEPMMDSLRSNSRFQELVRSVGLPQ